MGIFGQAFSLIAVLYKYRSLFFNVDNLWTNWLFLHSLSTLINSKLFYSQVIHNYPQFPIHKMWITI